MLSLPLNFLPNLILILMKRLLFICCVSLCVYSCSKEEIEDPERMNFTPSLEVLERAATQDSTTIDSTATPTTTNSIEKDEIKDGDV